MKKVIFLGSKPIGYECLNYLVENASSLDIELVGVLTKENNSFGKSNIQELCKNNAIPIIEDLDEVSKIEGIDLLISVQYHKILKKAHIENAGLSINLHMAPLPEYRGCNQFTHAILNKDEVFGTTIHVLDEGIDSGDLIFERRFAIPKNCVVNELYNRTFDESVLLFKESIGRILSGDYKVTPQSELLKSRSTSLNYRNEINKLKEINWEDSSKEDIITQIRATAMPGFDPPYAIVDGKKIKFLIEE